MKLTSHTVVKNKKMSYRDQHRSLYQDLNLFITAVKLDILIWGFMKIDPLSEQASCGHLGNCNFSHLHVGFIVLITDYFIDYLLSIR